jgi:hypothetical protein
MRHSEAEKHGEEIPVSPNRFRNWPKNEFCPHEGSRVGYLLASGSAPPRDTRSRSFGLRPARLTSTLSASSITRLKSPRPAYYLAHPTFSWAREASCRRRRHLALNYQLKQMTVVIDLLQSVLLRWRGPQKTRPEPLAKEPRHRTALPATPSWLSYPRLVLLVIWLWQPLPCTAVGTARPGPWPGRE